MKTIYSLAKDIDVTATWDLLESTAACRQGDWSFDLQPTDPTHFGRFHSNRSDWQAVSIKPLPDHSMVTEESYTRATDLITRFAQTAKDEYAFQLNWRILAGADSFVAGVELWVSIQTTLLDSSPELEVSSCSQGGKWRIYTHQDLTGSTEKGQKNSTAALVLVESDSTRLWLIEPSDQVDSELLSSPEAAIQRIKLFDHFMEKGVIRRARMRFWVAPGEVEFSELQAAYREFANSPLPLTA